MRRLHGSPQSSRIVPRLAAAAALLCCASAAPAQEAWVQVAPSDGGFTVLAPPNVKPAAKDMSTPLGKLTFRAYYSGQGDIAFVVLYTDYPAGSLRKYTASQILTSARNTAVAQVFAKVQSDKAVTFKGYPARDLLMSATNRDAVIRCRMVLVGRRLYEVMAAWPTKMAKDPSVDRFLSSFRIVKRQAAPAKPAARPARRTR